MKVRIAGTYVTKFGELWNKSFFDLAKEAAIEAIKDSNVPIEKIDAVYVANMLYSRFGQQDHLGPVITSILNINKPAFHVEAACASGGIAVNLAIQSLIANVYNNVLVLGVEKMTDVPTPEATAGLMGAASEEERRAGLTFPGLYALMARAHMQKFKTTRKHLAQVSVKNHYHASLNDKAQYPFEITLEKVLESAPVAKPLTLLDCSPITDGAAAIVLTSENLQKNDAYITASALATDSIDLSQRKSLTELAATKIAAGFALKQANLTIKNIDIAEVHDCFSIAEILALEDLGFCKKGQGGEFVASGQTKLGGKIPVNTSGGLKACGHPVGATGIKQIVEITSQLKGKSEKRQAKNVKTGLTHNVGGSGGTVTVHIIQI